MKAKFKSQRGAVLAVALIMLVVLTLVAVTGMRGAIQQERMAGNMRDRSLAFQAAEITIRSAENFIQGVAIMPPSNAIFDGNNGLLNLAHAEPDYYNITNTWSAANSGLYAGQNIGFVESQPRFVIKYLGVKQASGNASVQTGGGYGQTAQGQDIHLFKIIARGTGQTPTAQVITQSYFGRF